jgi:Biotin-requiring enzyme
MSARGPAFTGGMSGVSSAADVTTPELSEGMASGTIIAWLVEDGQEVAAGEMKCTPVQWEARSPCATS